MATPYISTVDTLDPDIHSHGESEETDYEKEEKTNWLEDPPESAAEGHCTIVTSFIEKFCISHPLRIYTNLWCRRSMSF